MNLAPFSNLIQKRCGILFNAEKEHLLREIVSHKIIKGGFKSEIDYLNRLIECKEEFSKLTNAITINETYFFREPAYFDILLDRLIPALLQKLKEGKRIKILSAGCSTGAEPYSIAIALAAKFGSLFDESFYISAFDIDSEALEKAEKAIYGQMSFREKKFGIPGHYFQDLGNGRFQLDKRIKSKVHFVNMNLMEPDMSSIVGSSYDIIFYRNVSIYFGLDTINSIFTNLSKILNEDGYIITSSTETYSHNMGILSLIELDGAFLYQKKNALDICDRRTTNRPSSDISSALKKMDDFLTKRTAAGKKARPVRVAAKEDKDDSKVSIPRVPVLKSPAEKSQRTERTAFDEAMAFAEEKKYDQAIKQIDIILEKEPGLIKAISLKVSILTNIGQFDEANRLCRKILEIDEWNLEGYILLGLICKINNNLEEAIQHFNKALYVEPSSWIVHFYLAESYMALGEIDKPLSEFEIAKKILEKGDIKKHGLTLFPLIFPAEQLIHLCTANIKKLKDRKNIL